MNGTNLVIEGTLSAGTAAGQPSPTLRDLLAVGFRQRRLIMHWFLGIFSIALLLALLLPKRYVAQMKILVRHERAESVVSAERESPVQWSTQVTE